ncbi:MAG: hypothetical protein NVSMB55_05200 [Mycobacteriales bacterium]
MERWGADARRAQSRQSSWQGMIDGREGAGTRKLVPDRGSRSVRSASGTDRACNALQIYVQPCNKVRAPGHASILPVHRRTLDLMSAVLTTRLHVDLQRVNSAICSRG